MGILHEFKNLLLFLELVFKILRSVLQNLYYSLVSAYNHFGYSFRTASKDFII